MSRLHPWSQWAVLFGLSLALATLLALAGFLAAFLLGPLLAGMALALRGATVRVKRPVFLAAQALIGCLVAHAITGSILATVAADWLVMLLTVGTTILAGGLVGWGLTRFAVLPGTTAAWGSSPGAASAMVAMAEEYGADPRLVAFMQYLRVVVVVLSASLVARLILGHSAPTVLQADVPLLPPWGPLLATLAVAGLGAVAGRLLRIPAGALLVPMTLGAVLQATGLLEITLPPWLLATAYMALGWYVGLGFDREVTLHAVRAIPRLLLATLALIGLCGLSAWLLTRLLGIDGLTAFLATSPGGLDFRRHHRCRQPCRRSVRAGDPDAAPVPDHPGGPAAGPPDRARGAGRRRSEAEIGRAAACESERGGAGQRADQIDPVGVAQIGQEIVDRHRRADLELEEPGLAVRVQAEIEARNSRAARQLGRSAPPPPDPPRSRVGREIADGQRQAGRLAGGLEGGYPQRSRPGSGSRQRHRS